MVASPICAEAEPPDVPKPIKLGYNSVDRSTVNIAVGKVKNQPAGCRVFYEIDVRLLSPTRADLPATTTAHMVFRDEENTDASPTGALQQVFRVSAADTGQRLFLFDQSKFYNLRKWRARAMNGNGYTSGWSAYMTSDQPSFGEP